MGLLAAFCRHYPQLKERSPTCPPLKSPLFLWRRRTSKSGRFKRPETQRRGLGGAVWDIIFISHLVHHFSDAQNRSLLKRAADALRPNGIVVILDVLRDSSRKAGSQTGALLDLYFAVTSLSGTFSAEQIARWMTPTQLYIERVSPLRSAPGISLVVAKQAADSKD
jgi:2-polyprenyl-3-methyl-5-hydroxy-6-metoxy-1,4-benzoquinol methylase